VATRDVMEQLRAAQPMPRGKRLAGMSAGSRNKKRLWLSLWIGAEDIPAWLKEIRSYAAPLALARERRRRERAEAEARLLRALMARPTRAEVEAALDAYEECASAHQEAFCELTDWVATSPAYAARSAEVDRLGIASAAAREHLFRLATGDTP
jgi:DNA-binding transcriptional ArsR family regulator